MGELRRKAKVRIFGYCQQTEAENDEGAQTLDAAARKGRRKEITDSGVRSVLKDDELWK